MERCQRAGGQSGHRRRRLTFPDHVTYVAGADVAVNTRVTFAFDVLGRYVIDAKRLTRETFHALDGQSSFPNIAFENQSFSEVNGAFGLKANLFGRLLLNLNLLIQPRHARLARQGHAAHRHRLLVLIVTAK